MSLPVRVLNSSTTFPSLPTSLPVFPPDPNVSAQSVPAAVRGGRQTFQPSQDASINEAILSLTLFGAPQLRYGSQPIPLARRQMRALLFRLATARQPLSRDQLCFLFWPDIADSAARRNLTVLLNQLRQALPYANVIQTQEETLLLNPQRLQTDLDAFAAALSLWTHHRHLDALIAAVACYAGPLLDGFALPASEEFEQWLAQERRLWERRYLDAATMLVDVYAGQGAYPEAIAVAQRALTVDPLDEGHHRQLIALYATAGDRRAALRQYETCVVVLERELGVSPLPETRAVYEAVRAGEIAPTAPPNSLPSVGNAVSGQSARLQAGDEVAFASAGTETGSAALRAIRPALPAPANPLIGRTDECAAMRKLLSQSETRLLTLTGTGGSGKTRLALQAASDLTDHFGDGVTFVSLAALRDAELVIPAIGQACGLKQSSPNVLADYFADKHVLLVLDNCEHLSAAGPDIAALLAAAPQLRVLATSRGPLNLQGEHTLPVPPLPLPDLSDLPPLAALAAIPAVALLVQRTQALNPRFQLTQDNAADVAAICVRLDGLPLALELAAARLKLLAPRDLARRLDRRLAVLTHGPQDLPERQRTLRATIHWSYHLLDLNEQLWFERCSTFVGGWTLAALEGMHEQLQQVGAVADGGDLLDVLAALVDKSLVRMQSDETGAPRFDFLETIREFAAERLHARGTAELIAQAHADAYLALIAPWNINAPTWLADIEAELDNLRAALRWYLGDPDRIEAALRLGNLLKRFWYWRDWLTEGRWWLEQIIAQSAEIETAARADLLVGAALQATTQGDTARALELHAATLELCERLNLGKQRANALTALATIHARKGDTGRAIGYLEEALTVARQIDNPDALSTAYYMLAGILVDEGREIPRALDLYEEALTIARVHQRPIVESMTLAALGIVYALTDNLARAAELLPQALRMQEAMNATMSLGWTHQYLGILAYLQGDDGRAARHFLESLESTPQGGAQYVIPLSLEGIAGVLGMRRQSVCAAQLLGAVEAMRERMELPHPPIEQEFYAAILASVQKALTPEAFAAAWQQGGRLTMSEAIRTATTAIRGRGNVPAA